MATLIDHFELAFPVTELPLPAIERYRMVPIQSLYLEIDFEDTDEGDARASSQSGSCEEAPQSDRYLRARCWASEE
ncbi:MAG: hypothetical protein ACLQVI_05875 [Polyangiaceae bacterium]